MAKYIHNISGSTKIYEGIEVENNAYLLIQDSKLIQFANSDFVIEEISAARAKMSDNGTSDLAGGISDQINFLKDTVRDVKVTEQPVFAAKKIGSKKLYTRAYGKTFSLSVGTNNLDFSIPFDEVKFNGIEIDKAKAGEKVSLKILDTPQGLISGQANYVLNQFGYDINLPDGFYRRMSDYDADLIKDLQVRIIYEATEARTIGINYMIHELKT